MAGPLNWSSLSACGGSPAWGFLDAVTELRRSFGLEHGLSTDRWSGSPKAASWREFAAGTLYPYFTVASQPPDEVPTIGDDHLRGILYSSASS